MLVRSFTQSLKITTIITIIVTIVNNTINTLPQVSQFCESLKPNLMKNRYKHTTRNHRLKINQETGKRNDIVYSINQR